MKLLYVSTIVKNNSFGEVSRKYLKMFEKYSDWDIYLFTIDGVENHKSEISSKFNPIQYIPNYKKKFNKNEVYSYYINGLYHLNDYILKINPDIVLMLHNDSDIYRYFNVLEEIRNVWEGKFVAFTPVDFENPLDHIFRVKYDACITLNEWSVNQIKEIDINYPVFSCPHIVDKFSKLDDITIKQNKIKIYGNANKYIVGCVNANNGRKRLDLVINAFIAFYETNRDSILFIKTTKFEKGGITTSFNLENFTKNYPIIISTEYLTTNELNILYNTFDIMINATDGEGFGLTPFEAALSGTLSILPNNSSFTSLIEEEIPNYLIPCKKYPYEYARSTQSIYETLNGEIFYSIYCDFKSYKNKTIVCKSFLNIVDDMQTYIVSKKMVPNGNVFSDMDKLLKAPWDDIQIQILITSDLESLRYFLNWLTINKDIIWPGINREREIISLKSLNSYIGTDAPRVGIIDTNDLCKKMNYYKKNPVECDNDLIHLRNFTLKNYNEEAVWNKFSGIINHLVDSSH